MNYGVTHLSIIPMRATASERAEMVSQLLFGEPYQVLETQDKWLYVKTMDCGYCGWIDRKLFNPLPQEADYQSQLRYFVRAQVLYAKRVGEHTAFPIFMGSSFPVPQAGRLSLGNYSFELALPDDEPDDLLTFAYKFLHAPYLWGGRTLTGIDCSGFTQQLYRSIGISLPRDASQQVMQGVGVDFVAEARLGDLAFFQNEEGKIVHVGMVCEEGKIIHASGWVRIDRLDDTGIFNVDTQQYTHSLRVIKRCF